MACSESWREVIPGRAQKLLCAGGTEATGAEARAVAAARTTSAFLTVGVTGAGCGHSSLSPSPHATGWLRGSSSTSACVPLPCYQMAGDTHERLLLRAGGLYAALHAPVLGHTGGPLRHGPKDQHKATRPSEAPSAGSPLDTLRPPQSLLLPPPPRKDRIFPQLGTWK